MGIELSREFTTIFIYTFCLIKRKGRNARKLRKDEINFRSGACENCLCSSNMYVEVKVISMKSNTLNGSFKYVFLPQMKPIAIMRNSASIIYNTFMVSFI